MEIAPNPERLDFETNINSINRTTSTMIFAGVTYNDQCNHQLDLR